MVNENFEREKACYEQNFAQARSLNTQMVNVPKLAMTLTGGLWFAAGLKENLDDVVRFALLWFAGFCNLSLILATFRIRDVLASYLEKIKEFHLEGYASGKPKEPRMGKLGNYSMISIFCSLMCMASIISFIGAHLYYWKFGLSVWYSVGFLSLLLILVLWGLFGPNILKRKKELNSWKKSVQKFIDKTARYYEKNKAEYFTSTFSADFSNLYENFLKNLPPNASILDAGSGSGRDTLAFTKLGYRVDAFDSSSSLCELSERLTGVKPTVLRFQDFKEFEKYDGIWACASLLHVPDVELSDSISRLITALKPKGILYMSFKKGTGERFANDGRFFNDMDTQKLEKFIGSIPTAKLSEVWTSQGEDRFQGNSQWLNAIVIKQPMGDVEKHE